MKFGLDSPHLVEYYWTMQSEREVVMARDARLSGPDVRRQVFGDVKSPTSGDPFMAPFFDAAIEHVWGGVWNRPGLELRYRSLVVVSVLAGAGGHNEELKTHLRGALNLGWTAEELLEALLQIAPYAGFTAAHEALDVLSEVITRG
ncbi:carboxymuconolactone decarboxylase family protein [Streptomyces sp. NPDC005708]|uniref:carboxymuconolactone decarboxylase family protein n=1 Tax=Streptomyces sp. NPDC005708 TaxID=3154564 RepID=UPI00340BA4FF